MTSSSISVEISVTLVTVLGSILVPSTAGVVKDAVGLPVSLEVTTAWVVTYLGVWVVVTPADEVIREAPVVLPFSGELSDDGEILVAYLVDGDSFTVVGCV